MQPSHLGSRLLQDALVFYCLVIAQVAGVKLSRVTRALLKLLGCTMIVEHVLHRLSS